MFYQEHANDDIRSGSQRDAIKNPAQNPAHAWDETEKLICIQTKERTASTF